MSGTPVVDLRVWRVGRVTPALLRVATQRRHLAGRPGLRFARLLGTGTGRTFTPRDVDAHVWAQLSVWDDDAAAEEGATELGRRWDAAARERLLVRMRPLTSRGLWGGVEPFAPAGTDGSEPRRPDGPVASITRARLRPARARAFWRAVPPVADDLHRAPGLRLTFGFGEAPVLLQGTFSLWDSSRDLVAFAHRTAAHREVVDRTPRAGWYAEELFARLAVERVSGSLRGVAP